MVFLVRPIVPKGLFARRAALSQSVVETTEGPLCTKCILRERARVAGKVAGNMDKRITKVSGNMDKRTPQKM